MKEESIRPAKLRDRYLELSAEDAIRCFSSQERDVIPCVACGEVETDFAFEKNGFQYVVCSSCSTLFQSPRPSLDQYEAFYRDSVSSRFWAEEFFPAVAEARRDTIFRARVEALLELCEQKQLKVDSIVDVGAGYGIFLEEWRKKAPDAQVLAIEPSHHLAEICRGKGLPVEECLAEDVQLQGEGADLVVCFEVLEHVHDALFFVETLSKLVKKGGYLFLSTLTVDGFDIQVLWEKSKSIFPPHHINFLSKDGFVQLFGRAGFEKVEVKTPGKLDVDIVKNALQEDSRVLENQRFLKNIVMNEELAKPFQEFLSNQGLSSHVWVLGQKL